MSANYSSMKFILTVCIKRFEEYQNRRTEAALEVQKRISGYVSIGSSDSFKPQHQYIMYEYGFAKAFGVLKNCCIQLLDKLGLFFQPDILDGDTDEAVSDIIWADYHLEIGVPQFRVLAKILKQRFGSSYATIAQKNILSNISDDLISIQALTPPSEPLSKLLNDIPVNPPDDNFSFLKKWFRSRSGNSTSIDFLDSPDKSLHIPAPTDDSVFLKRFDVGRNTRQ